MYSGSSGGSSGASGWATSLGGAASSEASVSSSRLRALAVRSRSFSAYDDFDLDRERAEHVAAWRAWWAGQQAPAEGATEASPGEGATDE